MPISPRSRALWLVVAAALLWHGVVLLRQADRVSRIRGGLDFASYHYAVQVAADGGDPYDKRQLSAAARAEGTRRSVHPFFYPPPFLPLMSWTAWFDLNGAYRTWFWLDALFSLAALGVLWRWWRPLGPAVGFALAATVALLTAIPNNHVMGQANHPVVLLVVAGLWADDRDRPWLGGALVGTACMMKMSPALFVMWWLARGRWTAAVASVATAIVLSVLALPWLDMAGQWRFYTEVLPEFASGRYSGLGVGIDLYGNHSIPNLWDLAHPAGPRHHVLSETARRGAQLTNLALLASVAAVLWRPPADDLARAAQVGAVCATMLLVPVFTYEHHLVWLTPAMVAAAAGVQRGRLGPVWGAVLVLAAAVWMVDLQILKGMYLEIQTTRPAVAVVLRESKFAAILVALVACLVLARRAPPEETP